MRFELKEIRGSSDGSYYFNVEGTFPVTFREFYKWILDNGPKSYRVEFRVTNECYGGAWDNVLEFDNRNSDKQWRITERTTKNFYDKFADKEIISCTADGGWGTMAYFCVLKEETEPIDTVEGNTNNITDLYKELADSLDDFKMLLSKPSTRCPEIAQQLLILTATLVKSIEFSRRGYKDCLPNSLVDDVETSQAAIRKWIDELEDPTPKSKQNTSSADTNYFSD